MRWGSGEAEIIGVDLVEDTGAMVTAIVSGGPLTLRVRYRAHERLARPVFGLAFTTADGVVVTGPNTRFSGYAIPWIEGDGFVDYRIESLPLLPGDYRITAAIYDQSCRHAYDHHERMYRLAVLADAPDAERYGVVRLPARWSHHDAADSFDDKVASVSVRGS